MIWFWFITAIIAVMFGIVQHERANYWRKRYATLLGVDEYSLGELKEVEIQRMDDV